MRSILLALLFFVFHLTANALNDSIDLELKFSTLTNDVPLYAKTSFTLTLINQGESRATNIEVLFAVQKPSVVFVGGIPIIVSKGFYRAHGDQIWEIESLEPQESATLELQLFFLETPELFAEVMAVDQTDADSTPNNGRQNEDDETVFPIVSDCSFFEQYVFDPPILSDVFDDLRKGIELTETDDLYQISGNSFDQLSSPTSNYILEIDKKGILQDFQVEVLPATIPATINSRGDNLVQLVRLGNDQDTLINSLIKVDYPNPTAIVINSPIRELSDGYLFGGFIVDIEGEQMFTGFLVKTDLNGENAQTMLISEINDTLGFREVLEDENGRLFIFWAAAGNFTITGTNTDFSTTWARQFASDTPSTRLNDIKLSMDDSKIYLGITDNLQAEVIAYDTATGEDVEGGFEVFNTFPSAADFRFTIMNGFLPLANGNLLVSFSYSEAGRTGNGYEYGLVNQNGQLIWSKSIAGEQLILLPVAQTNDGGFLLLGQNTPREFVGLSVLKINFDGERIPSCEEENINKSLVNQNSSITAELFPNPTIDLLYLNVTVEEVFEEVISIFDAQGRLVKNEQMLFFKGDNLIELDVRSLPLGVYFVELSNSLLHKRFLKVK